MPEIIEVRRQLPYEILGMQALMRAGSLLPLDQVEELRKTRYSDAKPVFSPVRVRDVASVFGQGYLTFLTIYCEGYEGVGHDLKIQQISEFSKGHSLSKSIMAATAGELLWRNPAPEKTQMFAFMQALGRDKGLNLNTFEDIYDYSTTKQSDFFEFAFRHFNFVHDGTYSEVVNESALIETIPEWFKGVNINFAENLMYSGAQDGCRGKRSTRGKEDDKIAITEVTERYEAPKHISWGTLRSEVVQMAEALRRGGVRQGDRVAVVSGNSISSMKVFLGITALGGIFSSSSTDMGVAGILDRLVQLRPKFIFCDDAAVYNGKTIDLREKINGIMEGLSSIQDFKGVVVMPRFIAEPYDLSHVPHSTPLSKFLGRRFSSAETARFQFTRVPFRDPFIIVYSSGTTGSPKCIAHSVGGVLLNTAIHNQLHIDQGPSDTALQFTTTGWIMYLLATVHLIHGARLVLYDGSPFYPKTMSYLDLISQEKVTMLGTSPKWIGEVQKQGIVPRDLVDLSSIRVLASTGMVLPDALFRWIYQKGFPPSVHLENVSGGTDIAGAFACGNSITPVYVGGMQGPQLGVAVTVFEEEEGLGLTGSFAQLGTPGELVITKAFPNMPTSFWGTDAKEKYFKSYFEKFNHVWTQGDNVLMIPGTRRLNFVGRSDGVLNPAGIRFGSSEIYTIVEQKFPQVSDSIAVGQKRPQDSDERVLLFLKMQDGEKFTPKLVADIRSAISKALSPRHVPAFIFETPDIPTTINLKKVELPVKKILSGKAFQPSSTLANPESLKFFYQFVDIEKMAAQKSKL